MAALPNQRPIAVPPLHTYYADANVFSADIEEPVQRKVDDAAYVKLPDGGGYEYQPADAYQIEGILSYKSGYTQVAGHPSTKLRGFTTLATSVLEGLNVLDVITADRIVGQISTTHPTYDDREDGGQVPSVTFLGTRFDNLRISGHLVEVERNLDILGTKPGNDASYFEDKGVFSRIAHQFANINRKSDLPDWAGQQFDWNEDQVRNGGEMKCSLVNSISGAPGTPFGHVIDLPHFGRIFLGELCVRREKTTDPEKGPDKYSFHLNMIRLELGCLAHGTAKMVALDTNGGGSRGGGH